MKKALLFIGLAMCTSIAFAQTNNYAKPQKARTNNELPSINLKELALQKADYKASIFTKQAGDTLAQFNFVSNPTNDGILYAANGLVQNGDMVDGVALTANGNTNAGARWQWIQDTNQMNGSSFSQTYPQLAGRFSGIAENMKYYLSDDGGFMLMSLIDLLPVPQGQQRVMELPHAYFQLPDIANPDLTENRVIDIAFTQIYRKFYDRCFIDYKIGNNWKAREINVTGVDADVNSYSALHVRYVMPLELGTQSNITVRFRYLGGTRSDAYGYAWGVDNVTIIVGGNDRWTADDQDFAGGAYGMVPQNMKLPLSWWAPVYNAGYNTVTGASLTASHIAPDGTTTDFATANMPNLTSGDPSAATAYYFNEQGLLYVDSLKTDFYYFYYAPGAYSGGHYMDSVNDPSLQYRYMSTSTLGRNRVAVSAAANADLTLHWDTIAYRVVDNTTTEEQDVEGYRWSHDNGIIPAGDSYQYGYAEDGQHITPEGNWDQNGYGVFVRYTTGNEIPVDDNGDPWVLRGMEIVTSPELTATQLSGTTMNPVTYVDVYEPSEETFYFAGLDNGVNNVSFRFENGSLISNSMLYDVAEAVGANYRSVNIEYPAQPELWPNTSYRIGYRLSSACTFAAATTRASYAYDYYTDNDGEQQARYESYDSNEVSAPWRHQFWPNALDVLVDDPGSTSGGLLVASCYHDSYPLIRAIVGPRRQLDSAYVNVLCEDENDNYIEYGNQVYCGNTVAVTETSGPTFYIYPGGDLRILDTLWIDSVPHLPATLDNDGDEDLIAYDYSIYDTIDWWGHDSVWTNVSREYWQYTFRDIHGTHTIWATTHEGEWITSGIDPVAPEVKMHLSPNPATSQVALNIKGVTGMVNCSIIDMSGRTVYNRQINAENVNTIDLQNVPAGAYFVRITNDTFSKVEKLIVR